MTQLIATIMAAGAVIAVPVAFVAIVVCAYLVPVNIWRIAQHLKGIREQLDRIATAAERQGSAGGDEFRELELARRRRVSVDSAAR